MPVSKGGTGGNTPFQAARRLGRTTYGCISAASAQVIEADIANFATTYGCVLYLNMYNGNTVANAQLRVNSIQHPIYTCFGEKLKGTEIIKNHTCEFVLVEATGSLPIRWVLVNPKQ